MWWPRLLAVAEIAWHGPADTLEFGPRLTRAVEQLRAGGVEVGPADQALFSLQFRYDTARREVLVSHQGAPGVTVELLGSTQAANVIRDGAPLPGPGTWQLVARVGAETVGEARTVEVVDHLARGRPIAFVMPTDARYPGTGAHTLVDGVRGTTFNDGFWNGWWGTDLDATIDLGAVAAVRAVSISLLEQVNSWIAYPERVTVLGSRDGTQWVRLGEREVAAEIRADAASRQVVTIPTGPETAMRWIRVVVPGGRRLPAWHPGAGNPAWIFADEILVHDASR
jgi:hexosaminidase